MLYDSFAAWVNSFLACIGGCLGKCTKPKNASTVDERSKGQHQGTVEKSGISEDFWTTSTYDIDNSAGVSRRSMSSISTSNQSFFCDLASATTNSHSEFVNHGLLLWNQVRVQWTGSRRAADQSREGEGEGEAPQSGISLNATYDSLLANRERFRQAIPLSEMVEFLVDVWDQEGLYD